MDFSTKYLRPQRILENNSGKDIVERAGYIPAQIRIENIINAGKRLQEYRAEQYDFADLSEIDYNFSDPTRSKGFDISDAFRLLQEVRTRRISAERTAQAEKNAQNLAQKDKSEQDSTTSQVKEKPVE